MKTLAVAFSLALLFGCTTTIEYEEFAFTMTIRDEVTKDPIPNLLVYLIHTDPSKEEIRYGPFMTDNTGTCLIEMPKKRIRFKGLPLRGDSFDFEISNEGSDFATIKTMYLEPETTSIELEIQKTGEA